MRFMASPSDTAPDVAWMIHLKRTQGGKTPITGWSQAFTARCAPNDSANQSYEENAVLR